MATFGVGSAVSSESLPLIPAPGNVHPSAPIPVQGPPLGQSVRVKLGETGAEIFPLILGGAEFGWNVDLESSHEIMDAYLERGGNACTPPTASPAGAASTSSGSGCTRAGSATT